jgi:hypothetical protein
MRYDDAFSEAGTAFAIVSPCSQCKNQLAEMSNDGKPFCPRRKWQADQASYTTQTGNPDPRMVPLAWYGTEGTPQSGDQSLRNPVYVAANNSTLVWIATLRDNAGLSDSNGNVIAPSILDPSFIPGSTQYIHCRPLPFVPAQHEAAYRASGGLKEGDQLVATTVQSQQFNSTTVPDVATNSDTNEYTSVMVDGVVSKVDLVFNAPRATVDLNHNVQGS